MIGRFVKSVSAAVLAAAIAAGGAPFSAPISAGAENVPIITVDAYSKRGEVSPYTLGANHRHGYGGFGMYDTEKNEVYPDFLSKAKEAKTGVVRYPGGTIANLFTWKDTIGKPEDRNNVVLGNSYESVFPSYGLDEHMRFTEAIGAKVIYMLGEASETPESAADLVEYLNCEVGENPNGGIDWAAVRAENGHPQPYGVTHFEIGNEMHLDNQRYWMSNPSTLGKTDFAKRYAEGDTVQMTNAVMRVYGNWNDNVSKGNEDQKFYSRYNPVVQASEAVYVDGEKWDKVDSLFSAGAEDKVYCFDYKTGEAVFGDGVHGAIPPEGAKITADYKHTHAGFTEYYTAMKAIDPDVKVYACMPRALDFLDLTKCDGIVNHNYINFPDGVNTADKLHDHYMNIADQLVDTNAVNDSVAKEKSHRNDFISAVTEFGTIPIPKVYSTDSGDIARDEARSLSRGLAFASVFIGSATTEMDIHVHQAYTAYSFGGGESLPNADFVYNSMYAPDSNDLSKTIESATALAYKVIGNGIADTVRTSWVEKNVQVKGAATYDALKVLATQDDENGDIYLLAVNRDPKKDITSAVDLKGYTINGVAEISTLGAESITSCNTPAHPEDVAISKTNQTLGLGKSGFVYTFPAHSLVSIKLSGRSENPYKLELKRNFDDDETGDLPGDFTVSGGTAAVKADPQDNENQALEIIRTGVNAKVTAALPDSYSDIIKISYRIKAAQQTGRLDVSVKGKDKEAVNLAIDTGYFKTGNRVRANYKANRWYNAELIINHRAKTMSMFVEGEYLNCTHVYNEPVTAALDSIVFDAENLDAKFYIDDLTVEVCDSKTEPEIAEISPVKLQTEAGVAPKMPETVDVKYTSGNIVQRPVAWDNIDPQSYADAGVFTVYGSVDGTQIKATAEITVLKKQLPPVPDRPNEYKPTVPGQPALKVSKVTYSSVNLSWTAASGAVKYELYAAKNGGSYKLLISTDKTSFVHRSVTTGTKYLYKVCAVGKNSMYGAYSSVRSAKPALGKPKGVRSVNLSGRKLKLKWKKVSGADSYVIYRSSKKNGGFKRIAAVKTLTCKTKKPAKKRIYYYKVRARRKRALSSYSARVAFKNK